MKKYLDIKVRLSDSEKIQGWKGDVLQIDLLSVDRIKSFLAENIGIDANSIEMQEKGFLTFQAILEVDHNEDITILLS